MMQPKKQSIRSTPPIINSTNTSRYNTILDGINREVDYEDELNRAIDFVSLYQLRKHQIGLRSILKAPILTERTQQSNKRHNKTGAKIQRVRGRFQQRPDKDLSFSPDTSFSSNQHKLNTKTVRNGPAPLYKTPHNLSKSRSQWPLVEQQRVRPCYVSEFIQDDKEDWLYNPRIQQQPPFNNVIGTFGKPPPQTHYKKPKQEDFQIEQNKTSQFGPTHSHSQTKIKTLWQSEQAYPPQNTQEYQQPSFIKLVTSNQQGQFNPIRMPTASQSNLKQDYSMPQWSVNQGFMTYDTIHQSKTGMGDDIKRRLHYYDKYDQSSFEEDQTRSMYESRSRPLKLPPSRKEIEKTEKTMSNTRSQFAFHETYRESEEHRSKSKSITMLSVEHEFQIDMQDQSYTRHQPIKYSQRFQLDDKERPQPKPKLLQKLQSFNSEQEQQQALPPPKPAFIERAHPIPINFKKKQEVSKIYGTQKLQTKPVRTQKQLMKTPRGSATKQQSTSTGKQQGVSSSKFLQTTPAKKQTNPVRKQTNPPKKQINPQKKQVNPPKKWTNSAQKQTNSTIKQKSKLQPKQYFKSDFPIHLKNLIDNKTISKVSINLNNPIINPHDFKMPDFSYQSNGDQFYNQVLAQEVQELEYHHRQKALKKGEHEEDNDEEEDDDHGY